jgi:hypothetical protein
VSIVLDVPVFIVEEPGAVKDQDGQHAEHAQPIDVVTPVLGGHFSSSEITSFQSKGEIGVARGQGTISGAKPWSQESLAQAA